MEHVVAYGISCDACGLHKKLGCVCSSGIGDRHGKSVYAMGRKRNIMPSVRLRSEARG